MRTVAPPDTWSYALRLPHDPRAARVARMTVRAALGGHGRVELIDDVELLTSEMVTNAYRHTRGPCSLRLTALGDGRLRVGVWDSHPYIPEPFRRPVADRIAPAPPGALGGRGLHLVRAYAQTWGAWSIGEGLPGRPGGGKLLWFEVGRTGKTGPLPVAEQTSAPPSSSSTGPETTSEPRQTFTPKSCAMPTRPDA
ncbi:ATP-binding protein [Streptomyces sp. CRN 30]|uniref:ATP-binding protein n=1 Tax=Streptomyces sp. CRN 30 TaxID=3075613 RepID=UPI002A83B5E6|nr:ATP-binding protein [Streptomyces sp. CRN 30]